MMEYHISELTWKKIFNFLKKCVGIYAYDEHEMRIFIESIWYIARTGCQWRLLPPAYGKWNSIYKRFKRWVNKGILQKLFEYFQNDSDTEFVMIDATIVRAQACAAGYKKIVRIKKLSAEAEVVFLQKFTLLLMLLVIRYISFSHLDKEMKLHKQKV